MDGAIFISYGREDRAVARKLYADLQQAGLKPWLDTENLRPGEEWQPAILRAIRESRFVIVLISTASAGRPGFVNREIREALEIVAQMPEGRPFLIPARIDECEPSHHALKNLQRVDLFEGWESAFRRIVAVISASDTTASSPHSATLPKLSALIRLRLSAKTDMTDTAEAICSLDPTAQLHVLFGPDDLLVEISNTDADVVSRNAEEIKSMEGILEGEISYAMRWRDDG